MNVIPVTEYGRMVNGAVVLDPLSVAVMVATVLLETGFVLIANCPEVDPSGIVRLGETLALELLDDKLTVTPG